MSIGDIKIADDGSGVWDFVIQDGDYVFTTEGSVEDVSQRCVYSLMTWLGESPYQTTAGLPHDQILGSNEPIEGIAGLYALELQETPGVDEVAGFDFIEPAAPDFVLTITADIRVGQTPAQIVLALPTIP